MFRAGVGVGCNNDDEDSSDSSNNDNDRVTHVSRFAFSRTAEKYRSFNSFDFQE